MAEIDILTIKGTDYQIRDAKAENMLSNIKDKIVIMSNSDIDTLFSAEQVDPLAGLGGVNLISDDEIDALFSSEQTDPLSSLGNIRLISDTDIDNMF